MGKTVIGVLLSCCALFVFSGAAAAADYSSIQLVGNFNGINCEPDDPANDMAPVGEHLWKKLKFINEPGDPDTIFFKFTAEHSYLPEHWGWSFVKGWGIAELAWSPPSIPAVLPDSGYWYFNFNDTTYEYWLDRPGASIEGIVRTVPPSGVPSGTKVSLFDGSSALIGVFEQFSADDFSFGNLPAGVFSLSVSAPGYTDTLVTGIMTSEGEAEYVEITLYPVTAVLISSASCERADGGFMLYWTTGSCAAGTGFDIYRGTLPYLSSMSRINERTVYCEPALSAYDFRYFDGSPEPGVDNYYYLVEVGVADPTRYGPLKGSASTPTAASSLGRNYPNPFNPATTIPYTVGGSGEGMSRVTFSFYDVSGKLVDRRDLGVKPAGAHSFEWSPSLSGGRNLPSGVYYCRLQIGKDVLTSKLLLIR